jgi:hypothetical protein
VTNATQLTQPTEADALLSTLTGWCYFCVRGHCEQCHSVTCEHHSYLSNLLAVK